MLRRVRRSRLPLQLIAAVLLWRPLVAVAQEPVFQRMALPFYMETADLHSDLVLNNNDRWPTVVHINAFSASGDERDAGSVSLTTTAPVHIRVRDLVEKDNPNFAVGHLEFDYVGRPMALKCDRVDITP